MKPKSFHFRSYLHKKYNPQPHSCAMCRNQPIKFSLVPDHRRTVNPPAMQWKPGVTDHMIYMAQVYDSIKGTNKREQALKMLSKCPRMSWNRAAPFYKNELECFESVGVQ